MPTSFQNKCFLWTEITRSSLRQTKIVQQIELPMAYTPKNIKISFIHSKLHREVLGYAVNKVVPPSSLWLFFCFSIFFSLLLLAVAHNKNIKENVKHDNIASERNIKIQLKLNIKNSTSSLINNFACNLSTIILSANTVYLYWLVGQLYHN